MRNFHHTKQAITIKQLLVGFFTVASLLTLLSTLGLLLDACGDGSSGGASSSNASNATLSNSNLGPLVPITLSTTEAPPAQTDLALAGPSLLSEPDYLGLAGSAAGGVTPDSGTISYSLAGCSSGLTGTPSSQSQVNVYLHDTSCFVKLNAFTLHGTVYNLTNSGAVAFSPAISSGTTGNVATFASSGGVLASVTVISQLTSPIQTTNYVSYEFAFDIAGTNSATITVGTAQSLYAAGQDAPSFKIGSGNINFFGMTSGQGQFEITLTCATGTSGTNGIMTGATFSFCPTVAGGAAPFGVDVNGALSPPQFAYKLVEDLAANEIGGNQTGTITMAAAISAMSGVSNGVTVGQVGSTTQSGLVVNSSANTGFIIDVTTPATMATAANAKMILILEALNTATGFTNNSTYASFEYIPISYTALTP